MQIRNSKLKYQAGYTHFCMVYPPWNEHTTWNTRLEDEFQFGKASYQMPCESFGECMGKVLFWNEDERTLELWNWNSKNKCEEYDTLKTLKCKVKTYTVYPFFGSFFVDSQQNNMFKWKSLRFWRMTFPNITVTSRLPSCHLLNHPFLVPCQHSLALNELAASSGALKTDGNRTVLSRYV